jgi:lycopene cyclase domain-containing protein
VRGAYLLCLLVSWAGVLAIDLRWHLALAQRSARARRTSLAVAALGTAFFLVWDLIAIDAAFYGRGDSPALLGVWVVDHLPLEEVVFVAFLSHVTLVVAAAVGRLQARAAGGAQDDERRADERASSEVRG